MPLRNFPETVVQLVFEYIDSVEQLEVLLFMRQNRESSYECSFISNELRSNPQSVLNRLHTLQKIGFVDERDGRFQYAPENEELDNVVAELADVYKVRPHKIFELIFSPLKKGRVFADAFVVTKPDANKKEPTDG